MSEVAMVRRAVLARRGVPEPCGAFALGGACVVSRALVFGEASA